MKKEYVKPAIQIVEVETDSLCITTSSEASESKTHNNMEEDTAKESNGHDIWEDD